ncbi:hypothetical protein RI129_008917 [Pyrocoelia pectoralis]|uniref:Uncharacterized protein n=1 Tax=Pyrocoelia pectoralis TaxID=417401 RepID=A0AAN7V6F4_9COLE
MTGPNGDLVKGIGSPYAADGRGFRQWFYPRRGRGAGRGGDYRPPREEYCDAVMVMGRLWRWILSFISCPPRSDEEQGDGDNGGPGRRPPKRFFRINFRGGGRGGGRRPLSSEGQGQGEQTGDEGSRGP